MDDMDLQVMMPEMLLTLLGKRPIPQDLQLPVRVSHQN